MAQHRPERGEEMEVQHRDGRKVMESEEPVQIGLVVPQIVTLLVVVVGDDTPVVVVDIVVGIAVVHVDNPLVVVAEIVVARIGAVLVAVESAEVA